MFYDILDQIMEFKTFLISTRRCRLAPLLLFYFNDSLFSETRIDKFGSLNIKKQTYLGLIYGLGQKIIFQAKSCNKTFFYLRTNVTLTSSCCWRGDRECRFLRTMRYVTYTHFVWDLFYYGKTIYLEKNWLKQNTYKIGKSWRRGIFSLPCSIIPYQQSSNVSSHKLSCKTIWTFEPNILLM